MSDQTFSLEQRSFKSREQLPLHDNRLWRIELGIVRTLTWADTGDTATLGIWGPSDIVGRPLSSLAAYQIECLSDVKACLLRFPDWELLGQALVKQFRQQEILTSFNVHITTRPRLINCLGWLATRFGQHEDDGILLDLGLTHQLLGELISSSHITVTRLVGQLEREGLLRRLGNQRLILLAPLDKFIAFTQ